MKCDKCGFENKDKAKFCTKCGHSLTHVAQRPVQNESNNSKYIIIALLVVIVILGGVIGYFALNMNSNSQQSSDVANDSSSNESDVATSSVSTSQSVSKSWESIGKYTGSGTGSEVIDVPAGKIKVKISAFPIKNYATNHVYVDGSNGESGAVDWGPKSPVETRSDSFTYTSSSEETFTIDYYETVDWEVEFFRYQ